MAHPTSGQRPPEVPDHELLQLIASGSYGQVWLARNVVGTQRAIKVVSRQRFDDSRPFEREFNGIQKYEPVSRSHDGLVDILHVGQNEAGGYFYYVMELADDASEPDEDYCARTLQREQRAAGRLPADDCIRIGMELAEALAHLHDHGLVHRDIKPSNIIFVGNRPKLADIGLVTDADATYSFVGTEGFIPKEGPGTPAADIYSLGKVLYEISTGLDRNQFPELPTAVGEQVDRKALLECNEVVLKACATDPEQRYSSARDMAQDLGLLMRGESVRRLRLLERRLSVMARSALGVLALILLISLGFYQAHRENKASRESLSRMLVAEGVREMEDGNQFKALHSFASALALDEGNLDRVRAHRLRLGATIRQLPMPVGIFHHDGDDVFQAGFDPRGGKIFSAGTDNTVRIWEINDARLLHRFTFEERLVSAQYSPDGLRLVTTTSSRQSRLWDPTNGLPVGSPFPHAISYTQGQVYYGFLMARHSLLLIKDGHILSVVEPIDLPRENVTMVFSLTGTTTGVEIEMQALDSAGKILARGHYLDDPAKDSALSRPNAGALSYLGAQGLASAGVYVVGTNDAEIVLDDFEVAQGSSTTDQPIPLKFSDNFDDDLQMGWAQYGFDSSTGHVLEQGRQLIIRSQGRGRPNFTGASWMEDTVGITTNQTLQFRVRLSSLKNGDPMLLFRLLPRDEYEAIFMADSLRQTLAFSPDGRSLVVRSDDHEAVMRSADTGEEVGHPLDRQSINHLTYLPSNGRILFSSKNRAGFWIPSTGEVLPIVAGHPGWIQRCLVSPDGRVFATQGGGTLELRAIESGKALAISSVVGENIGWAEFSPDGSRLLVVREEQTVECMDLATGKPVISAIRHDYPVRRCGFSPDGRLIVTVTEESKAYLWSAMTGRPMSPPLRHSVLAGMPAFDASGQLLLTVDHSRGAWLWDLGTIDPFEFPIPPTRLFNPIVFSPDGTMETSFEEGAGLQVHQRTSGLRLPIPNSGRVPSLRQLLFTADNRSLILESREGTTRVWDVMTGDPITPSFPTRYTVESLEYPWVDFPVEPRPAEQLLTLAQGLSDPRGDDPGWFTSGRQSTAVASRPDWQGLMGDKTNTVTCRESWHEINAVQCEQDWDWWGALFHLEQLVRVQPDNTDVRQRRDYARDSWNAARKRSSSFHGMKEVIPPRLPHGEGFMLDLSAHYTQSIKQPLIVGQLDHNLGDLPCLVQTFGGVPFDIRGLVRIGPMWGGGSVSGSSSAIGASKSLTLTVNRSMSNIHFLHAATGWEPLRTEVAQYVIHYIDGTVETIPLIYGSDIKSLESGVFDSLTTVESSWFHSQMQTVLAWAGTNPWIRSRNQVLRLFRSTWQNPYPERLVKWIEVSSRSRTGIFLVAVSHD